jgi:hypothetical protein
MKIYKYELPCGDETLVIKEKVIKFLDVQNQNNIAMVWALVDDAQVKEKETTIAAFGTGWDIPDYVDEYIGTAQDEFGFVWHYFTVDIPELEKEEISELTNVGNDGYTASLGQADFIVNWEELLNALGKIGASAEQVQ